MGLIKEYVDQAVQTETDTVPSPYADPAVVLAAPPLTRHGLSQGAYVSYSVSESTPPTSDSAYVVPQSPISPILASLVSRRLSQRKLIRCPPSEILNRRIVSMPEKKSDIPSIFCDRHGKRVVSMPDRVRPVLEPSAELSISPCTTASDSFGSYSGRRERVRVLPAPSDVPQTPSPPSSPESLLIIAAGAQLPEGFLRKRYSPEPLVEEDEDWVTWANSPPRPIPALHGPLSLPYARCPSGAEGTIIEEPDNVAQMIWGLGPDDQLNNQVRAEGPPSHPNNTSNAHSHGPSHAAPRLQKRKVPIQQVPRSSRLQISTHSTHSKPSLARTQRQTHDDRHGFPSQLSSDVEIHQDNVGGLSWNEGQSTSAASDNLLSDSDVLPVNNNRILEWQLARLRHALRTSLADMDSFTTYPGRLDPVIPASVASGFPQSYPRIFVEPRPNESVIPAARQPPIELAQQYRQQQLCRQFQKQKLQVQSVLPTPPNSSSPQWSSHFSPYLTYCSTLSPELAGSPEHLISVPSQSYRSGVHTSQYLRPVFDQHEHSGVHDSDTITNIPSPQSVPNVTTSTASFRQRSSSSSTLAKYIKQLQTLTPIAHLSPLQPVPPPNVPLSPLPSIDETTISPVPTFPSPESPRTLSRGSSYHTVRSFASTRPMQRRLSSVPEEDSAVLELSTSVSPSRLQRQITTDNSSSSRDGTIGHQHHYLEVPPVDVTRKMAVPDFPDFPEPEGNGGTPPIAFHETSPVKVRLPVNKEQNIPEQANGHQEQHKGHRKKHRYKKPRGPTTMNERARPCGLVG